jgi:hypothetical protein
MGFSKTSIFMLSRQDFEEGDDVGDSFSSGLRKVQAPNAMRAKYPGIAITFIICFVPACISSFL